MCVLSMYKMSLSTRSGCFIPLELDIDAGNKIQALEQWELLIAEP